MSWRVEEISWPRVSSLLRLAEEDLASVFPDSAGRATSFTAPNSVLYHSVWEMFCMQTDEREENQAIVSIEVKTADDRIQCRLTQTFWKTGSGSVPQTKSQYKIPQRWTGGILSKASKRRKKSACSLRNAYKFSLCKKGNNTQLWEVYNDRLSGKSLKRAHR